MSALLQQYFYIAFLMRRPQDLPNGSSQVWFAVVLSFFTYVVAVGIVAEPGAALLRALLDLGCSAAVFYVGLRVVGRIERFEQAFGALCGASAILNIAALPVFLARQPTLDGGVSGFAAFTDFLFLVWSLSLLAHILRHTFEMGRFASTAAAFAYFILLVTLMNGVLPAPSSPA